MASHPAWPQLGIAVDDRLEAIEDAIDIQRRMIDVGAEMVALHRHLKLGATDAGLFNELNEACASALACAEEMREAIERYRGCR
jgi:hypothetical protein